MIAAIRWIVTLLASRQDAERLAGEFSELFVVEGSPNDSIADLHLELDDPEGDAAEEPALNVGRAVIEAHVRRINGFGKLRWGRIFEGVEITNFETIDAKGETTTVYFLERPGKFMLPDEWVQRSDELGIPRARLPVGMEALSVLDGQTVATLAATNRNVALVLRLVDEKLAGEDEIDWGAAFSALEVIEHDLREVGLNGQDLGWWTAKERGNFRATANSVEVLGEHARHGRPFGLTDARMDSSSANWLVRRVAALWVTRLIEEGTRAGN